MKKTGRARIAGRIVEERSKRLNEQVQQILEQHGHTRKTLPVEVPLRDIVSALKAIRASKGATLAEVSKISGVAAANLCDLEKATDPNPTLRTLLRYTYGLGKTIKVVIEDANPGHGSCSSR